MSQITPAQQHWYDDPDILVRVDRVWDMYRQRTRLADIAKSLSVSVGTVRQDIERARALIRGAVTADILEKLGESIAIREMISREAWEAHQALKKSRARNSETGETILFWKEATAEADLLRTIMQNEKDLEELLQLRRRSADGDYTENNTVVVIDGSGVAHKAINKTLEKMRAIEAG